jgi:hypothetical protein
MEKAFTYQRHLRYTHHFVLGAIAGAIVLSWVVPQILYWTDFVYLRSTTRLSLYLTFTLLALGMLVLRAGRELRDTVYIVTNDRLVVRTPTRVGSMLFEAVESFRYRRVAGLVGYGELRSGDTVIRLPAIIRDLSGLVSMVRRLLDEAGRDSVYDREEIERFILRSRVNDLSEERTYDAMPAVSLTALGAALLSFIVAVRIWHLPLLFAIAWSLLSGIVPAASYLVSNTLVSAAVRRRMKRGLDTPESVDPRQYYVAVGGAALVLYLALGIAFKAYGLYWRVM